MTLRKRRPENGEQYYSPQFVVGAMRVYTEYQHQLWDPSCEGIIPHEEDPSKVDSLMKEWHFHQYGGLGVFMVDMRGNHVTSSGQVLFGRSILSDEQVQALRDAWHFVHAGLQRDSIRHVQSETSAKECRKDSVLDKSLVLRGEEDRCLV